jgi:hypothetical protein
MDGLTSLVGLTGYTIDNPEATPEDRSGNAADPRHANVGEQAQPYSWQSLAVPGAIPDPPGPSDSGLIEHDYDWYSTLVASQIEDLPAGDTAPWTHAGPWPADPIGDGSVGPDNAVRQLEMNAALRSLKVGPANRAMWRPWANPTQDAWQEIWEVNPNSDDIPVATNQMKASLAPGGRGSTDRRQSFAKQNDYGFDSRHMRRRFAVGHIPGNFPWMKPAGRPLVKGIPGPAKPAIGPHSQFAGQNLGAAFGTNGAILENPPNAYAGPAVPYIAPQSPTDQTQDPYDYTDYYGM